MPSTNSFPGRRNQYPQPQGPGFQEDRRDRGPGPGPRDRGFSRDTDRDRDRNRDRDRGGGPSKGSRKDPRSVAERIELERPNRILFVRNISVSVFHSMLFISPVFSRFR